MFDTFQTILGLLFGISFDAFGIILGLLFGTFFDAFGLLLAPKITLGHLKVFLGAPGVPLGVLRAPFQLPKGSQNR